MTEATYQYNDADNCWWFEPAQDQLAIGLPGSRDCPDPEAREFANSVCPRVSEIAQTIHEWMLAYFLDARREEFANGFHPQGMRVLQVEKSVELFGDYGDPYFQWSFEVHLEKVTGLWHVWRFECEQQ